MASAAPPQTPRSAGKSGRGGLLRRKLSGLFGSGGSSPAAAAASPLAAASTPVSRDKTPPWVALEQRRGAEMKRLQEEEDRRIHALRSEASAAAAAAAAAEAERLAPVEVASARANQVMALKDGRHLSFAEAGDPNGFPVVCFFGIGGSRYLVLLLDQVAKSLNLRVISPDRPGFGRSSLKPDRRFTDFAQDIENFLDVLHIDRFGLWGYSVGCAYATVCLLSETLRSRVATRLTLVSPWIPLSAPGVPVHFSLAKLFPRSVGDFLRPNDIAERRAELKRRGSADQVLATLGDDLAMMSAPSAKLNFRGTSKKDDERQQQLYKKRIVVVDDPNSPRNDEESSISTTLLYSLFLCGGAAGDASSKKTTKTLAFEEDAAVGSRPPEGKDDNELTQAELRALETLPRGPRVLLASIIEAQRQGPEGFSDEFTLCCSDFGFEYRDAEWPARVYHGTDDNLVSSTSVRWLVAELRRGVKSPTDVELFQVLGGTHNGMVFAILNRSLTALANDVKSHHIKERGYSS